MHITHNGGAQTPTQLVISLIRKIGGGHVILMEDEDGIYQKNHHVRTIGT